MPTNRGGVFRVLGEFALIVTGVLVALFAEDARQRWEERATTQATIRLLVDDLRADSLELARARSYAPGSRLPLAFILVNTQREDVPADSVLGALRSLLSSTSYNPVRSAFTLLVQQDRLRFIGDESLQSSIVSYYESNQDGVVGWDLFYLDSYLAYTEAVSPHMVPAPESSEQVLGRWFNMPMRLHTSWDAIRSDHSLLNALYWRQASGDFLEDFMDEAMIANSNLRVRLHELLVE